MVRQKRILDPSLAKIANTDTRNQGFYGQERPTPEASSQSRRNVHERPRRRVGPVRRRTNQNPRTNPNSRRTPNVPKQSLKSQAELDLKSFATIIEALKECVDPFEFERKVKAIRKRLESKKESLAPSEELESLAAQITEFKQDRDTIHSRISTIEAERTRVASEFESHKLNVKQLQTQLQNARTQLSNTQRILEDLEKVHFDSQNEQKTIIENLERKENELQMLEESNNDRREALDLLLEAEASLNEASKDVDVLRQEFYTNWESWNPEQMVAWMCQQGSEFEQYRPSLSKLLPQQAQSGADFLYFDSHVLLGLGIGLIRHRGQMMSSIQSLTGGSRL